MWALIAHGYMEENDVKSTWGGTRLEIKIKTDEKVSIQNLMLCKIFNSKADETKKVYF